MGQINEKHLSKEKDKFDEIVDKQLLQNSVYVRPDFDRIQKRTNFTHMEMTRLYTSFKQAAPNGALTESQCVEGFAACFPHGQSEAYAKHVFRATDAAGKGYLTFEREKHFKMIPDNHGRKFKNDRENTCQNFWKLSNFESGKIGTFPNEIWQHAKKILAGQSNGMCRMTIELFVTKHHYHVTMDMTVMIFTLTRDDNLKRKLQWLFRLYDTDEDSCLSKMNLQEMLICIYELNGYDRDKACDCAQKHLQTLPFFTTHSALQEDDFIEICQKDDLMMQLVVSAAELFKTLIS